MRFDPQPPPIGTYPEIGVMYAATMPHTALGEVFQETRVIDRAFRSNAIVSWVPSRPLQLLDLTSNWPVVNGGAASMQMDDKRHTSAWAHAIDQQLGVDLDGLYHLSSINGLPLVTLFSRTERVPAFPARPKALALLTEPMADFLIEQAVRELGYGSV